MEEKRNKSKNANKYKIASVCSIIGFICEPKQG